MERFTIRPAAEDARIYDPATGDRIPADGRDLPRNAYWLALVARGDMIEVQPSPEPAPIKGRRPSATEE